MPTNRTRRTRGARLPLTGQQTLHLLRGWCLAVNTEYDDLGFPFRDEAHRKELWVQHRDYLMSLSGVGRIPGVFGGSLKAGEKPSAYYEYESQKRERKIL